MEQEVGDHLGGSTAGFGKKLHEINQELNQEAQQEALQNSKGKYQSSKKKQGSTSDHIKMKAKFDLNFERIKD